MSCAQVMYQPYAHSPYMVQPDTPQAAPPHPSASTTPGGDSRHGEGVLHIAPQAPPPPQPPQPSSLAPHTPPHLHHPLHLHHHHHSPPHSHGGGEGGGVGGQTQQQAQQGAAEPGRAQRPLPRPPYRTASTEPPEPDGPPEKKFCRDTEVPPTSAAPHHHHPPHPHPHHSHHHHHHHHPPITEPSGSPTEEANEVKYVSANCMVVTHYLGDAGSVVDEHFSRALAAAAAAPLHYEKPHSPGKASSPMTARNFPPSFWNSHYQIPSSCSSSSSSSSSRPPSLAGQFGSSPGELYDPYHPGGLPHHLQASSHDPWAAYSLSSQAYGHRSMAHDMYQAAMSSVPSSSRAYHHHHHQYPSLALQPHHLPRLPTVTPVASQMGVGKPETWGARYHDHFPAHDFTHGLDSNYSAATHYPNVPGLETGVPQDGAKDLYWF